MRCGIAVLCALSVGCVGCTDIERTGEAITNSTPLELLPDVVLGMSAEDLIESRPHIEFSPYRGYSEDVDSFSVLYQFDGMSASDTDVRRSKRLASVLMTRAAQDTAQARTLWEIAVSDVSTVHGSPDECSDLPGPSRGRQALWSTDEVHLAIAWRSAFSTGQDSISDRIVYLLTADTSFLVHQSRTVTRCDRFPSGM